MLLEALIPASPDAVWHALADDDVRARWWSYLTVDGCSFVERWGDGQVTRGEVLEVVPAARLRCSWQDDGWPSCTEVTIELAAATDGGTRVVLTHTGWDVLPDGAALEAAHREGWRRHLDAWGAAAAGLA